MTDPIDALLRRVPEGTGEPVDDAEIVALGRRPDDAVAARVAESPGSRRLLVGLAEAGRGDDERATQAALDATAPGRLRRRLLAGSALAAAAAAAVALALVGPDTPGYTLEGPLGGQALHRGEAAGSATFGPGSTFVLFARPDAAPAGDPPRCRAFVIADGAAPIPVAAGVTLAPSGVCRLEAPAADLFPRPGRYRVALVLGDGALDDPGTLSTTIRYEELP
ncbi:MAG: hypothetical protein R3F60_04265 [bacterium]